MVNFSKRGSCLATMLLGVSVSTLAATVDFRALIANDVTGCSVQVPSSSLTFSALKARDLIGEVTTYQIQPLQVVLQCTGADSPTTPTLSVTGNTPYEGTENTVFLDGAKNGVGFMVRQGDGNPPALSEFYNTAEAVVNNGDPLVMTTLDTSNNYYREEPFWVGVVGPLGGTVVPGPFSSTLIVNVVFQ